MIRYLARGSEGVAIEGARILYRFLVFNGLTKDTWCTKPSPRQVDSVEQFLSNSVPVLGTIHYLLIHLNANRVKTTLE